MDKVDLEEYNSLLDKYDRLKASLDATNKKYDAIIGIFRRTLWRRCVATDLSAEDIISIVLKIDSGNASNVVGAMREVAVDDIVFERFGGVFGRGESCDEEGK